MRSRSLLAAAIVLVVAAVTVFADEIAPEPSEPLAPEAPEVSEPLAGSWVCGVGEADGQGRFDLIAAHTGTQSDDGAQVDVTRFEEGEVDDSSSAQIDPGEDARFELDDDPDELAGTMLSWQDGATVLWREWALGGVDGLPEVTIAGGCAQPAATEWVIPGFSTVDGDSAVLRLSNPHATAANLALSFLTPEGEEQPVALENLTVPAASVREIDVNEFLPEEADLSAVVRVGSGRLSVEGVQFTDSQIGTVDGGSLLAAAPEARETWVVPWIAENDTTTSWLWVANPGEQTASVELTMYTDEGGHVPQGLSEVSIPPGQMRRVDLGGTLPEDSEEVALAARSNGVPVVVSGAVEVGADDPDRSGFAVQLGAYTTDTSWVTAGRTARIRTEALLVSNPTGEDATVDVSIFDGSAILTPVEGLAVPAGSTRQVDIDEIRGDAADWTAFVEASEGEVVVGRVGTSPDEDRMLRLIAAPAVPSADWAAQSSGLVPVSESGLVSQLRTGQSPIPAVEDSAPESEDPDSEAQDADEPGEDATDGGTSDEPDEAEPDEAEQNEAPADPDADNG